MSITYENLKNLVLASNKTGIKKSFEVIERKIMKEYEQQNKEEIKYLKNLIKKVSNDKPADLSIILGESEMSKNEKLIVLNDLLDNTKKYNIPIDFTIMIETLPSTLQKLIKPKQIIQKIVKEKEQPKKVNAIKKIQQEQEEKQQNIMAKQILSIEPFDFFVLLPFYTLNPEQSNVLENILNLDQNLLPNKYTIFESFNTIVEKKHLTGEYFEYNVKQSDLSKKFMEIEPSLHNVLFDFTKLNKKAIQTARKEMLELVTVLEILYNFQPKDYSSIAPIVIQNIIRIYNNLIQNSKENKDIIKYLVRSIEVLEHRRKQMQNELPQLIKDDDKRKFLTKETATLLEKPPQTQPIQDVQEEDVELGEHYNDRFEDDGFDDLDIVPEEDSELYGGEHKLVDM